MKMNEMYETPMVEAIDVEVEKGFAQTNAPGMRPGEDFGDEENY